MIVFLDAFAEARAEAEGTLDLAVRAASSLASRYLARNDRVGLVSFGGILRWLVPSMGRTQVFQIVDALLDTEIAFSYAWKGVDVIPPRKDDGDLYLIEIVHENWRGYADSPSDALTLFIDDYATLDAQLGDPVTAAPGGSARPDN